MTAKSDKIIALVEGVTKKWAKQKKAEERHAAAIANRRYALTSRRGTTIKDAAWSTMEAAYLKASANGTLPAHARQIMYAARPHIQHVTGRELDDKYFTQTLLPDYMEENDECSEWNVVFDARGHFHEPHTRREVPLGTMEVREYLEDIVEHEVEEPKFDVREERYPTLGPANRYGDILFIEKEGFLPLFRAVQLAERYDIAIMSTKGMSVTASRELIDDLCGEHPVRLLVLHDFDKAGFSIVGTLRRDTRRYAFRNSNIEVIDLGMRIGDIGGLQDEAANITNNEWAARRNLKENGATPEEIAVLLERRVELNAFTSDALVVWIEQKLAEHGVKKLVPDDTTLADAFRRANEHVAVQEMIDKSIGALRERLKDAPVPAHLRLELEKGLAANPTRTWDSIVMELAAKLRSKEG
jgi:hypothetical protein